MEWKSDEELVRLIREELFTAVIGDVLDAHGYMAQFLPPTLAPLHPEMMVVGRAMPVLHMDVDTSNDAYGLLFEALDDLKPGEVYLASGGSQTYALWGELMTTAAKARGAVGAVIHGCIRDTSGILAMGDFPVFCCGRYGQDQKGRGQAIAYRVEIRIGNVLVQPGDMLIGDLDGVVAVPRSVENEVFTDALLKARTEKTIKRDLEQGMLASQAFKKYGIL